ncbi:MAG: DNA starvation/stationary phase protection protein Dps [Candidatus Tectomicrobia bacterium]|nr:DNA starvation/stationary phase protection protein Dps [Candidatus Tectomicrobia bacterium]
MATRNEKLHTTANDLPADVRTEIIPILQASLADALDLHTQLKQAHWNIKGPNFIAPHQLFDEIAGSATVWVDDLAERLVALGGQAKGTVRASAAESRLPDYPLDITDEREHLQAVVKSLSSFGAPVRGAIDTCQEKGDQDTSDLFIDISRQVDKYPWFVEAHLR